jgi:Tol biopolymer transport system component
MKKTALALILGMALLFSAFFSFSVRAENWSTPTPVLYMEESITGLSMSEDGNKIALTAKVNGTPQVFVANWDGSDMKQLTDGSRHNSVPSISGYGAKLTFLSYVATEYSWGEIQEGFQGFVVNSDGTGLKRIPPESNEGDCSYISISDDGGKLAFLNGYHEICVINPDGTGLEKLTNPTMLWGDVPAISGDASKVIFIGYINSEYELFVVSSDGTTLTQITDGTGDGNGCGPVISVDGRTIVFHDWIPNNGTLWLASFTNSTELWSKPTPVLTIEYSIGEICVNADGSRLFFTTRDDYSGWGQNSDRLFTVRSDGTGLTEIRSGPSGSFSSLTISGDGSKIAFIDYANNGIFVSVDLAAGLTVPVPATPLATPSPSPIPARLSTRDPVAPTPNPTSSVSPSPNTSPTPSFSATPELSEKPPSSKDNALNFEPAQAVIVVGSTGAFSVASIGLLVCLRKRWRTKGS